MGAVFVVGAEFVGFEASEGFGGVVGAVGVGGVEDVAEVVAGEAVEAGVVCDEFGAEAGAAVGVEGEGLAVMAQIPGPAGQRVAGVGQLQHPRQNVVQVGGTVGFGGEDGELFFYVVFQMCTPYFLPGNKIMRKRILIGEQTGVKLWICKFGVH